MVTDTNLLTYCLLTELDDFSAMDDEELWGDLCYVAVSRARNYLIILSPDNTCDRIISKPEQSDKCSDYSDVLLYPGIAT